jgi:hypothetical protein
MIMHTPTGKYRPGDDDEFDESIIWTCSFPKPYYVPSIKEILEDL